MGHPPTVEPPGPPPPARHAPARARLILLAILLLDLWLRGHTFGPLVRQRLGLDLWPATGAEGEPLDCDEAIYTYYGRRIVNGDVLYRDLSEPKPPGGYWLYALAVAIGGASEWTARVLPVPIVLATIALVWSVALRLAGPVAACLAALIYALASTDPYLHGNGSNLEHPINLLATASIALTVRALRRPGRGPIVAAGSCLGAACLFKQVAFTHLVVSAVALAVGRAGSRAARPRVLDLMALAGGFLLPIGLSALVLAGQGAGRAAWDDVVIYGAAMAAETPPPPNAPPSWVRLVAGNSDPRTGALPWPFGRTDYLVWWGTGTWPLWLALLPAVAWLAIGPGSDVARRLVAAWTLSACVQVALPGLFWPHYFLLPLPGLAISVAVLLADGIALARSGRPSAWIGWLAVPAVAAAVVGTAAIQARDYLLVPPQELAARYKGGRQWIAQRALGRELARRTARWTSPRLFVWGTQSPLFVYSGIDGVSRHAFADPLMQAKATADPDHPLIRPRLDRILSDLRARPPEIISAADPPFPALLAFLKERYEPWRLHVHLPDGRGVWIDRRRIDEFEAAGTAADRR